MNIKQAMSLIVSVKKITKKRCPACGGVRSFKIGSIEADGAKRHEVRVVCRCSEIIYKDFDR